MFYRKTTNRYSTRCCWLHG